MPYEYKDFEEKINHIIEEALDSKNYENLSKKISSAIDNGIFGFSGQGGAAAGRAEYERRKAYMNSSAPHTAQRQRSYADNAAAGEGPLRARITHLRS